MDFILLHENGKPVLIKTNTIQVIRPPLKGKKYIVITDMDHTIEVDETFQEISTSLITMDVEIIECAND